MLLTACDPASRQDLKQDIDVNKGKTILVIGSVNADHVLNVGSLPAPGQTVKGTGYSIIPGGKGANQAVASARLGGNVSLMACVGEDAVGAEMVKQFQSDQINTSLLEKIAGEPTGIALIFVDAQGENSIGISAEANGKLTPQKIQRRQQRIAEFDFLLMQLEIPEDSVLKAAQYASENGACVVLNPAPAQALPDQLLALTNIITPNETETEILTGITVKDEDGAKKAAQQLHDKGVSTVIITMGAKGAFVSSSNGCHRVPGFKVMAKDTTAAGDTFNGALVVALSEGKPLDAAVRFANAAAAISVTTEGAQPSIPSREAVERFLEAL